MKDTNYLKQELYDKMQQSSELFDFIQEETIDGLWYWDLEQLEYEWMNPKFWETLGYDPKEKKHLSREWQNIINKDDLKTATKNFKKHLVNPKYPYDQIVRYCHKKGHTVWIRCRGIALRDKKGEPTRMLGMHIDITQYKEQELALKEQKNLLDNFFDQSLYGFFVYTLDEPIDWNENSDKEKILEYALSHQHITKLNQALLDYYGVKREEFVGKTPKDILKNNLEYARKVWRELYDNGSLHIEILHAKLDGIPLVLEGDYRCFYDDKGRILGHFGVEIDISIRKMQEKVIEEKNISMVQYINHIDKYIISSSTDTQGVITNISEAFCRISGYKKQELIGKKHNIVRHPDMPNELYEVMWETISLAKVWQGEIKNLDKNGQKYWTDLTIEPKFDKNKNIIGYSSVSFDITAKKIIEKASLTDGLTNVYNRRYFNDIFPKIINSAKRNDELLCFLMIDIDNFKQYNDNYGHQAGDNVLIELAKCFRSTLKRVDDMVFRLGGEEFGIVYKEDTKEKALEFANQVRENIQNLNMIHDFTSIDIKVVTASMGLVCEYASKIKDMETIYKQADELLYESKEAGRNKVSTNVI